MARTIVPSEIFIRNASEVRHLKYVQEGIVQNLNNIVNEIAQVLDNSEYIIFREKFGSMNSTLENFIKILGDYAELMDTYANRYSECVYAAPPIDRF